ncbi:protocatechuate 3,4-dioxygenase subunit alpha [Rhodococcus antarcticus]|uniref:Protocatechuate 3,4-dioxygenase subunit alpha n=1 Tax=Rhodococcus antarcticus TaxID=2987751 RepID=A0ABY6P004_9NOCA|nr:protocatechuate 3,4-dioxygenase subunit alpha [Rhodococcus antarcticus]UZJ24989.1 protocatechuate 3,4-dioxygenase subunit alpha [Rhodococcus antarcticus]
MTSEPTTPSRTTHSWTTPSQTIGPFFHAALPWADGSDVDPDGDVTLTVRVLDGAGELVTDALVETWQADAGGRFDHPEGGGSSFRGFGRCPADATGTAVFRTVKPGPLPAEDGLVQSPHVDLSIFARGLLHRVVTRLYFPDEAAANATDPVLLSLGSDAGRLVATAVAGGYHLDVHLQGAAETPFFAV